MDEQRLFEGIIERLLKIKIRVFRQDQTPEGTVEVPHPAKVMTFGLSFPNASDTIGKSWNEHIKKEERIFPEFWQLALHFCSWYRLCGGL